MLDTKRESVLMNCPEGHEFTATILSGINAGSDPDLIRTLNPDGTQIILCPTCARSFDVAEPVSLHDEARSFFALIVPDCLAHRTLELKMHALRALKSMSAQRLHSYVIQFEVMSLRKAIIASKPDNDPLRDGGSPQKSSAGIHRAFADLASIVPAPEKK